LTKARTRPHLQTLETRLRRYLSGYVWLVVAGSIPPSIDVAIYHHLIEVGNDLGAHTVLDADAEALSAGLSGGPEIVKSNHHEAERLLGRELLDDDALLRAAEDMRMRGAGTAIITAGSRGAVAVSAEGVWWSWPPHTPVVSSIGAGDALLAGLLMTLEDGGKLAEGLRWGTAAGSAACLSAGTQLCRQEEVARLLPMVRVEQVERRQPQPAARR
jgi:6-phosphofructokinase 2